MLTFMKSKLRWLAKDKQNHIFWKSKSYEISSADIYIREDWEFIIHVFYWCIPLDHSILTVKEHLTWLGISSHNICSGIKSQQVKKDICYSVPKTFWFFSEFPCSILSSNFRPINFMGAFSRLTKWKLAKLKKKLKEIPYPPQKKLLKRKGKSITPAKTNIPISKTSSEC